MKSNSNELLQSVSTYRRSYADVKVMRIPFHTAAWVLSPANRSASTDLPAQIWQLRSANTVSQLCHARHPFGHLKQIYVYRN